MSLFISLVLIILNSVYNGPYLTNKTIKWYRIFQNLKFELNQIRQPYIDLTLCLHIILQNTFVNKVTTNTWINLWNFVHFMKFLHRSFILFHFQFDLFFFSRFFFSSVCLHCVMYRNDKIKFHQQIINIILIIIMMMNIISDNSNRRIYTKYCRIE